MKNQMISQETLGFLIQYWWDIGSSLSIRLANLAIQNKWSDIAMIISSIDNQSIANRNPVRLRKARLAVDIIKKADFLPIDIDTVSVAFDKWCSSEAQCRRTNEVIGYYIHDARENTYFLEKAVGLNQTKLLKEYLPKIQKEFNKIIGVYPDNFDFFGGFGPGATLSNTRRNSSTLHKLSTTPSITEDALWFTPAFPRRLRTCWGSESLWNVVMAGRLQFVPKSFKTDRPIMVEPLVNASIQRSFGLYFARRLRHFGIDLSTAPDKHSEMARIGSITGRWVTIDLSSASDTIALELVRYLVGDQSHWWRVLDASRTKWVDLEGAWDEYPSTCNKYGLYNPTHRLEKFSSMGNGFTFELETILFLSICRAVCSPEQVGGVFGDDIVVAPNECVRLMEVLNALGFTVNSEKTFVTGSFRESCGGDFADGIPVKGVTLKSEPCCVQDFYDLHNRIWQVQSYKGEFASTLKYIRKCVPKRYRLEIPERLGSGGFFHEKPKGKLIDGITYYKCLVPIQKYKKSWERDFSPEVQLAAGLLGKVATDEKGRLLGPALPVWSQSWKLAWVACS